MIFTTRSLILNGNIGVTRKVIALVDVSPDVPNAYLTIRIESIDNGNVVKDETLEPKFTRPGYNIAILETFTVCRYVRVSVSGVGIQCVHDIQFLGIGDILG